MNICMVDPLFYPYFGGTEKVVYEVGKRLAKRDDFEVSILTSQIPGTPRKEEKDGMVIHRVPCLYFKDLPAFLPPPFSIAPTLILELLKRKEADAIHFHNRFWYYAPTLSTAKWVMGKKLLLTIHNARPGGDVSIDTATDFSAGLYDTTMGRVFFEMMDRIHCVSEHACEVTIPKSLRSKSQVIYNGVDTANFNPEKGRGSVREKFGIGQGDQMILSNGRLITQKGFKYLIDGFADVKKEYPNAKLVVIGKGPLKEKLHERAKKRGLEGSFFTTTGIPEEELPLYYNAADLFVLASLYEPSAVVLYEALSAGKPIVATRIGGNPEIVSSDCGLMAEARSPDSLRDRMLELLGDEQKMKVMSQESRKRAVENFDWDIIASKWAVMYKDVLT